MDVQDRTIDAALRLLADAHVAELFAFLTQERLHGEIDGDGLGRAPDRRRMAREFAEGGRFSTEAVVDRTLDTIIGEIIELSEESSGPYVDAMREADLARLATRFLFALASDSFEFDPTGDDARRNGRARLFHLCGALADGDRRMARTMRTYLTRQTDTYARTGLYELGLARLNRALAPGVSAAQMHLAIHSYLRGVTFYERCGVLTPHLLRAQTILGIIWSHTVPAVEPESPTLAEFLAALAAAGTPRSE